MPGYTPNLSNIQGNIFGGFNKDFQIMLFLHFDPANSAGGTAWLKDMASNIATSEEVVAFNNMFKLVRARHGKEGFVRATWTNIAFTFSGLQALGVSQAELDAFPQAFKDGMAARADIIGDMGKSDPSQWVGGSNVKMGSTEIHAVLIVASDTKDDVDPDVAGSLAAGYIADISALGKGAVEVVYQQRGATRLDIKGQAGHEQFGFKDGVSQPGIRGIDEPDNVADPNQGNPGQDLLWPGEFVLGYPTQIREPNTFVDGPNPDPGPISRCGPEWTYDGSFLVFRRLRQDVQGFNQYVTSLSGSLGLSEDLTGAKVVGRYKSGCPLERRKDQPDSYVPPPVDPGIANPDLGNSNAINNFFEYGKDPSGNLVPRAAHIRKAYPRDQKGTFSSGTETESATQTHRLLRRGIPFGASLGAAEHGGADEAFPFDRGLLFLCYQSDLERQFEFVQQRWINDENFPCPDAKDLKDEFGNILYPDGGNGPDGEDPLISETSQGTFAIPQQNGTTARLTDLKHFVTMTGGDYFFAPSITALYHIAGDVPPM